MTITEFANANRLRLTKDSCGDEVIAGRVGESTIAEYDEGVMCVAFVTQGKLLPRTGLFNTFKVACIEAGMTPCQIGDAEGVFSFDPENHKQAKVAIKGIRVKSKKQMSAEQIASCAARLAAARARAGAAA
jgi:hypothetical protein